MWVLPIVSAYTIYLNQGILKENFIVGSTFNFPSAPYRDSNEGLQIDPFIF